MYIEKLRVYSGSFSGLQADFLPALSLCVVYCAVLLVSKNFRHSS